MSELSITHTAAEGTLLGGTRKGDGAWEAIKTAQAAYRIRGWRYFPSIRAIGVSHSRDHAPKLGLIDRTAEILREAGFTVTVDVDGAPRSMADAEAARAERMDDHAAALHGRAERLRTEADTRFDAANAIAEAIPFGQPIQRGHHSERAHRRDLERRDGHLRASVAASDLAAAAAMGAVSAEHHMQTRTNPRRVYRRIRTQEAELRKVERELEGHVTRHLDHQGRPLYVFTHEAATGRYAEELLGRQAHLRESIRYWREALEQARAAGADVPPDPAAIRKGWWVHSWAGWTEVVRVNKVTVTVLDSYGPDRPQFRRKITLDDIRSIRETNPAAETPPGRLAAELAALAAADTAADTAAAAARSDAEPEQAPPVPSARVTSDPAPSAARSEAGLSEGAVSALAGVLATDRAVHLPVVPLERDLYAELDGLLCRIGGGGRWDRRERAYVYTRDPRPELERLLGAPVPPPSSGSRDKELSYWPTPAPVAAELARVVVGLPRSASVLEPSAGDGALVAAVREANPEVFVTAIEVDPARAGLLGRRHGGERVQVRCQRFQDYATPDGDTGCPDRPARFAAAVMNPPFTEPGDRHAWVAHLELAWSLLGAGGRLAAIAPASLEFSRLRRVAAARELITTAGGTWRALPEDAFQTSGTSVRTVLVTATHP